MSNIAPLIQPAVIAAAIFGVALAVAWYSEIAAVVWRSELDQLRQLCRSLSHDNEYLVKEHARLWREVAYLKRLLAIDEIAQSTTRAMLKVAAEERRAIDARAVDR